MKCQICYKNVDYLIYRNGKGHCSKCEDFSMKCDWCGDPSSVLYLNYERGTSTVCRKCLNKKIPKKVLMEDF